MPEVNIPFLFAKGILGGENLFQIAMSTNQLCVNSRFPAENCFVKVAAGGVVGVFEIQLAQMCLKSGIGC